MHFGSSRESIVDPGVVSASANGILTHDHAEEIHRHRRHTVDLFSIN
jgi:hypothetical protein